MGFVMPDTSILMPLLKSHRIKDKQGESKID